MSAVRDAVGVFEQRLGAAFRAVRVKRRWRQEDVAARAGVSRGVVSLIERGHLEAVTFGALRAVAHALDIRVDLVARWHGGELERLVNAGHSAMHEAVATMFGRLAGWTFVPEVSFSIYGERGVVDIVGWHAESRSLLVIELKTEIVDVQELAGNVDRKTRLGKVIVRERGWEPRVVSTWVIVADGTTNRRRVADHRGMLRAALPAGGREMAAWLREPDGRIGALSFLSSANDGSGIRRIAPTKRVRPPTAARRVAVDGSRAAGTGIVPR